MYDALWRGLWRWPRSDAIAVENGAYAIKRAAIGGTSLTADKLEKKNVGPLTRVSAELELPRFQVPLRNVIVLE